MAQGLVGLGGAAGAGAALERLLARRFQEQQEAARQQQAQQQAAQDQQRLALEARRVAAAERPEPESPVNQQIDWQTGQAFNPRTGGISMVPGFTPRPVEPPKPQDQPNLQVDWLSGQRFNPSTGEVTAIPNFKPRPVRTPRAPAGPQLGMPAEYFKWIQGLTKDNPNDVQTATQKALQFAPPGSDPQRIVQAVREAFGMTARPSAGEQGRVPADVRLRLQTELSNWEIEGAELDDEEYASGRQMIIDRILGNAGLPR